jgi:peroxiredoxin
VAVAWYTYADARPRVLLAFSGDGGESFSAPVEVDAPRGRSAPIGRVDLVLLDGGEAVVSWLASDREEATWLARRVRPDGQVAAPFTLATTRASRDSGFPRLERAGDSLVAIWTEVATPSRIRGRRVPLASIPAEFAAVPRPAEAAGSARAEVGQPVPRIQATATAGGAVSLQDLKGEVVLVNLWATWCEPCRHELPELTALHRRYAARGLRVVAISVDRDRTLAEVAAFAERRQLPFAIWHDPTDQASGRLGARLLPSNFLVGRDGTLAWRRTGAITADDPEVMAAIERALAPP